MFEAPINSDELQKLIPHRYPFLLIDRVLEYKINEYLVAIKNVTNNEELFNGHFPNKSVYPGVFIVEGMAQSMAVLFFLRNTEEAGKVVLFTGIDKCKFRKKVIPGDQITFEVRPVNIKETFAKAEAVAKVNNEVVAEAVLTAIVAKDEDGGNG